MQGRTLEKRSRNDSPKNCKGCQQAPAAPKNEATDMSTIPKNQQSGNPLRRDYWTKDNNLSGLKTLVERSNMEWLMHEAKASDHYRGVTLGLVRRLKAIPGWAALSDEQAASA